MTMDRRSFFVRGASAIAVGTLLDNQLMEQATGQTPAAEALYVNVSGADTNTGTKDKPLKSLAEAAKRVNASKDKSALRLNVISASFATTLNFKPFSARLFH